MIDAMNWYRCLAAQREQEIARLNAELIEVRNSAEHQSRLWGATR